MKKAIIFLNGDCPRKNEIKNEELIESLKICADGAYRYVKEICVPDVVLGDFDSIGAEKIDKSCKKQRIAHLCFLVYAFFLYSEGEIPFVF